MTEPYQFPVTTDSPEWAELAEAGLARNACRLPAGLAEQMTSEALLETALDYPYVSSILAFSDPVQGFWSNAKYNDALAELVTRPNAAAVVERAFSKLPPLTEITDVEVMIRWTYLSAFPRGWPIPQRREASQGQAPAVRRPSRKAWMAVNSGPFRNPPPSQR